MNVKELRAAIKKLEPMQPFGQYPRFTWQRRQAEIREKILMEDPTEFLTWPMIHEALFVGDAPWVAHELKTLTTERWQRGIQENKFGKPTRLAANANTSGNMTHQAYILKQWEDAAGEHVENLKSVFEFGGGYGAMAKVCNQLGFTGPHVIHDLPEFLLLQQFYLSQVDATNAVFVQQIESLAEMEFDLFIAGCSLSETPFKVRDKVLNTIKAKNYVILYQGYYMKRDNLGYFDQFAKENPDIEWHNYQVPHWPAHWYLVGTSIDNE